MPFHTPDRVRSSVVQISAPFAVPNNIETQVTGYDLVNIDTDNVVTANGILVPAGAVMCRYSAQAEFAANAGGFRQITVYFDAVATGSLSRVLGNLFFPSNCTLITGSGFGNVSSLAGFLINMRALQTSGAPLNIVRSFLYAQFYFA